MLVTKDPRVALTIAGFDPSGGAGVLADTRTFAAFGLNGAAAITALTFQNAEHFFGSVSQSADAVRKQVEAIVQTNKIACTKTGMLPTREVVEEVVRLFRDGGLPAPVVDPVFISSTGKRLMEEDAIEILIAQLFPLSRVVTPNISEAERLTGARITSEADMRAAAARIRELGAPAVLVKGGHLPEAAGGTTQAIDVLDGDGKVTVFSEQRVPGVELHGSGCILSAAIAAGLGKGMTLEESVAGAKSFVAAEFKRLAV
jgi:hydroxymethylpyrimidine/phosphomethylpyrimidine kinase